MKIKTILLHKYSKCDNDVMGVSIIKLVITVFLIYLKFCKMNIRLIKKLLIKL